MGRPWVGRCLALLLALVGLAAQATTEPIQSQTEGVVAAYEADPSKENLQKLIQVYERARQSAGEGDEATILARNYLVFAYADHNEISKAVGSISRVGLADLPLSARRLYQQRAMTLGPKHPLTIQAKSYIAYGLLKNADYTAAVTLAKEAVAEAQSGLNQASHAAFMAYLVITNVYTVLGREDDAADYARLALEAAEALVGTDHPSYAEALLNHGNAASAAARHEEGLAHYRRSLEIFHKHYGELSRSASVAHSNIAITLAKLGDKEGAVAHAEKSLSIAQAILPESHPDTLAALNGLTAVYVMVRDTENAVRAANELIRSADKISDQKFRLEGQISLAVAFFLEGNMDQAIVLLEQTVTEIEQLRSDLKHSPDEQSGTFSKYSIVHKLLAIAYMNVRNVDASFRVTEAAKARTLLEETSYRLAEGGGIINMQEKLALDRLESSIRELDARISYNRAAAVNVAGLEVNRDQLSRQLLGLRASLADKYPKYRQLTKLGWDQVDDAKKLLPANTLFVEFMVFDGKVAYAYVLDSCTNQIFMARQKDPNLDLAKLVALYRGAIAHAVIPNSDRLRLWKSALGDHAIARQTPGRLYAEVRDLQQIEAFIGEQLLGPIKSKLVAAERLIVAPDDVLTSIPFESLRLDGQRLLDKYDISYVQSLRMYGLLKQRWISQRDISPKDYFGLGGVSYASAGSGGGATRGDKARRAEVMASLGDSQRHRATADIAAQPLIWSDLPNTKKEIVNVAQLFADSQRKTVLGNLATEKNFRRWNDSGELKTYKYLHLATHGYLSQTTPSHNPVQKPQGGC